VASDNHAYLIGQGRAMWLWMSDCGVQHRRGYERSGCASAQVLRLATPAKVVSSGAT